MLYCRMFLTLIISLFTSRIILSTLGVVDFGIYNVLGGVVAAFAFLNGTLSGATSRFITYELGSSKIERLKKTFASALTIHLGVAVLILILGETVGLWLMENELVIPENRMFAARVVYQMSLLSSVISIIRVPFNAAIIAHERMSIYAYVGILEAVFKLAIVYLIIICSFDKLIIYAILILCITLITTSVYILYGYLNFKECRFTLCFDKKIMNPMLSYSGWDLYGNMSVMARGQGINVLLNLFFGPIVNAASGIATQVQNAIAGFADNFLIAVRPQIVKYFASGNMQEMQKLIFNSSKFSFFLLFLISFPLILENRFVLDLWLKEVPEYSIVFCQLSLINNLISIMFRTIMFSIHATGKMERISIINGTIYLLVLPISYFMLKNDYPPITPFLINIFLLILGCVSNLITLHKYIPEFSIRLFFTKVIVICMFIACISSIIPFVFYFYMESGFGRLALVSFTTFFSISISVYYIVLDREQQVKIKSILINKISF